MDEAVNNENYLRSLDKFLFWLGVPFLLPLFGNIFLNQDQEAQASFLLFAAHSLLLLFMIIEKNFRTKDTRSQSLIFVSWFLFGFGLGGLTGNILISILVGFLLAIIGVSLKMTTDSITILVLIGWLINIYISFTSSFTFFNKLIYLFSPNIWYENGMKLAVVIFILLVIQSLRFSRAEVNEKTAPVQPGRRRQHQGNAGGSTRSAGGNTGSQKIIKESTIQRITDQEEIKKLYKGLDKVKHFIDSDYTSDAAANLRLVSEQFTKQISIHNNLDLDKMDQFSRLQALQDGNYISDELYGLLTTIRRIGNEAVHEFGGDDRFSKNGLLKLHYQLSDHINKWAMTDSNEEEDVIDLDYESGSNYDYDYNQDTDTSYGEDQYNYDDEDDEYEYVDYDDEDDEDEDEQEQRRYRYTEVTSKEIREKMQF